MARIINFTAGHAAAADRRPTASEGAGIVFLPRPDHSAESQLRHDPFGLVAAARALIESFENAKRGAAQLSNATAQLRSNADGIATCSANIRALTAQFREAAGKMR